MAAMASAASDPALIPPTSSRRPVPLALGLAALAAFAVLTWFVETGATAEWDRNILLAVLPLRTPTLTTLFQAISYLGVGEFAIPAGLAICFGLRWGGLRRSASFYAAVTLGGWAFNLLLKQIIARPRPDVIPHLGRGGWYTFPSGHSMMAVLVYALGALLLARLLHRAVARGTLLTVAMVAVAGVAVARIYLGVHYPADVLGGLLAGSGWGLLWWGLKPPIEATSSSAT